MTSPEEKALMQQFKEETGKNAIWKGNFTKGFLEWKRKNIGVAVNKKSSDSISLNALQTEIIQIKSILRSFDSRLKKLENSNLNPQETAPMEEISQEHFERILRISYDSIEKRFGDFGSIAALTDKIREYIPWNRELIHDTLYKLFMEYKIDLQPGKKTDGEPLIKDGKVFVWFKFK